MNVMHVRALALGMIVNTAVALSLQQHTRSVQNLQDEAVGSVHSLERAYASVVSLRSDQAMTAFVKRMLADEGKYVQRDQESELAGFAPWFSGTKATQSFEQLRNELFKSSWVKDLRTVDGASLSEADYQAISALHDARAMRMFVLALLKSQSGVIPPKVPVLALLQEDAEVIPENEEEMIKSLQEMQAELFKRTVMHNVTDDFGVLEEIMGPAAENTSHEIGNAHAGDSHQEASAAAHVRHQRNAKATAGSFSPEKVAEEAAPVQPVTIKEKLNKALSAWMKAFLAWWRAKVSGDGGVSNELSSNQTYSIDAHGAARIRPFSSDSVPKGEERRKALSNQSASGDKQERNRSSAKNRTGTFSIQTGRVASNTTKGLANHTGRVAQGRADAQTNTDQKDRAAKNRTEILSNGTGKVAKKGTDAPSKQTAPAGVERKVRAHQNGTRGQHHRNHTGANESSPSSRHAVLAKDNASVGKQLRHARSNQSASVDNNRSKAVARNNASTVKKRMKASSNHNGQRDRNRSDILANQSVPLAEEHEAHAHRNASKGHQRNRHVANQSHPLEKERHHDHANASASLSKEHEAHAHRNASKGHQRNRHVVANQSHPLEKERHHDHANASASLSKDRANQSAASIPSRGAKDAHCVQCIVWGDANILSFNAYRTRAAAHPNKEAELYARVGTADQFTAVEQGTYWLAKNSEVHIQGRYWHYNKSKPDSVGLGAIAISGPMVGNNTLVIRSLSGEMTWNGQEILPAVGATFTNEFLSARYMSDVGPVAANTHTSGVRFDFANGVRLTVARYRKKLTASIMICGSDEELPPMEGQCGNLERVPRPLALAMQKTERLEKSDHIF